MWPFRRRRESKHAMVKKVIVGLVIGSAIASIIGKNMAEKTKEEDASNEGEDE